MRLKSLLLSCFSLFVLSLPAAAGQLVFWRFDTSANQLHFRTNAGVQPKAMLMFNPTRLVIDLPGTDFNSRTVKKTSLSGTIQSLRVGQLDDKTARLVVELKPGYTLDPQKVLFRGASPRQWSVQLPKPERIDERAVQAPLNPSL